MTTEESKPATKTFRWEDLPETIVFETIKRRQFHTDVLTMTYYQMAEGSVFPRHTHPESQITMVLSGEFTFDYGDRVEQYQAGETVFIPGGVPHEGRAENGPAEILGIVSPPRG